MKSKVINMKVLSRQDIARQLGCRLVELRLDAVRQITNTEALEVFRDISTGNSLLVSNKKIIPARGGEPFWVRNGSSLIPAI